MARNLVTMKDPAEDNIKLTAKDGAFNSLTQQHLIRLHSVGWPPIRTVTVAGVREADREREREKAGG